MRVATLAVLCALIATDNLGLRNRSSALVRAQDAGEEAAEGSVAAGAEQYEFQAETNRLMDIIINSLYKNKEIFLRELISNASDALDKLRFLAVSDPEALAGGDDELKVSVSVDKDARTLTVTDTGVGMTRADLIANLGTIAKSGTTNFVEAMGQGGDLSLIGQFGVGFYSIYLAADRVQVISKHKDDEQHIWESTADSTFTVRPDPTGNTLGRGTSIVLHLKHDADEFLEEKRLSDLIHRYSEFITFPIYQQIEKEVEVPADEETEDIEDADTDEPKETDDETEEAEPKEPKTQKIKVKEWERVNQSQAIWSRPKEEISDEEYQAFYKSLSQAYEAGDAATWTHFKGEGDVEFKSILFAPSLASYDQYEKYYERPAALKLYVRKVLIKDDFEDLVPRYLNFIKGVVDSDDLPLNVSREMLQNHKAVKVMSKILTKKALAMITELANSSIKKNAEAGDDEADEDKDEGTEEGRDKYIKFYEQFGRNLKMGITEDAPNRSKLAKLLRFKTSKSDDKWVSFQEYKDRMPEWQKSIFYMSGPTAEHVEKSPFMEKFKAKDVEVLYLTEPADEYCIGHIPDFGGTKLTSIDRDNVKLGDENEKSWKGLSKHYVQQYKPLMNFLKEQFGSKVSRVVISRNASKAPCLILSPEYGHTANMERLMKAQAFADAKMASRFSSRIMEINPRHPIVSKLAELVETDKESQQAKDLAWLMFETALAASGFSIDAVDEFTARIYSVMGYSMDVTNMDLLPVPDVPEEPEEEPAAAVDGTSPAGGEDSESPEFSDEKINEMMAEFQRQAQAEKEQGGGDVEDIDEDDEDIRDEL